MSELVGSFSKIFKEFEPEELFLPHRGDSHSDHRVVFDATAACTKWFRYPSIKSVLAYETASETEFGLSKEMLFKPNYFIDISDYLNTKLEILKIYESEIGEHPFPRSIDSLEALAKWRGSNSGYKAAEAFELLYNRN
jgi:LmbE family N-acetylglucosaminyl deacetylase